MGDKRPAAIASAGDAASGAKAAMHTPYGRLCNRARTRTVRPPRPVRSTIILRYGRGGAPDSSCTACAQAAADPATRCWPRFGLLAAGKDARRALLCSRLPERRSHAAARFARSMRSRMADKYGDGAICAPYRSQMAIVRHEICDPAAQGKALSSAEPHPHYTQTIR